MIDLYTWSTPNGRKISILLEELKVNYKVIPINIMKNENISTTTLLLGFNILLVLVGLLMINKKILNNDEQSDSLKAKIDQIETQLDVLIDDSKIAREKVIVANEDFIQLSNSMAVNDKILKNLN